MLADAIDALTKARDNMDTVYGPCAESREQMNALTGEGKLEKILNFVEG